MFGRDFKLSAYVILAKLIEKLIVFVIKEIVISDSRADKYALYVRNLSELFKQFEIVAVRNIHILARIWKKALPIFAYAVYELSLT